MNNYKILLVDDEPNLLKNIPRLMSVASIVRHQDSSYAEGSQDPDNDCFHWVLE